VDVDAVAVAVDGGVDRTDLGFEVVEREGAKHTNDERIARTPSSRPRTA